MTGLHMEPANNAGQLCLVSVQPLTKLQAGPFGKQPDMRRHDAAGPHLLAREGGEQSDGSLCCPALQQGACKGGTPAEAWHVDSKVERPSCISPLPWMRWAAHRGTGQQPCSAAA